MPPISTSATVLSSAPFGELADNSQTYAPENPGSMADQLEIGLVNFMEQPDDETCWQGLLAARRNSAEILSNLSRKELQSPVVQKALQQIVAMLQAGVYDRASAAEDRMRAMGWATKGWPGLLASMVLTPAWSWREVPLLQDVPDWLVTDYCRWIFSTPKLFLQTGDAEMFAEHIRLHAADLAGWVKRSPGSAAVRLAAEVFLGQDVSRALAASAGDLRSYAESRGIIAQRFFGQKKDDYIPLALPRVGRRLRVAVWWWRLWAPVRQRDCGSCQGRCRIYLSGFVCIYILLFS